MSKFADTLKFPDEPQSPEWKKYSIAWVVKRVIEDTAANPEMKQIGASKMFTLRKLQELSIGAKDARKLQSDDVIDFAMELIARPVKPCTVNQYIGYLAVCLEYAGARWKKECGDIKRTPVDEARPYLEQHNLVGKSEPRKVKPTDEQVEEFARYFDERASHGKVKLKRLGDFIRFAAKSSRRRGEVCRLTFGDIDWESRQYCIRDCKHPTKKKGNDKWFALWPELEAILRRQPRERPDDPSERVWPYRPSSVTQAFIAMKKEMEARGFKVRGIRLHDHRGKAISDWLLKGLPPEDVRVLVSGHDNTKILEKVYDRRNTAEVLQAKYEHLMQRPA